MRASGSLLLSIVPLLGGCWAAAGAGAGYLVAREFDASAAERSAEFGLDIELVWHAARETLLALGAPQIEEYERPRRCVGVVEGSAIEFEVVREGLNRTRVTVRAVADFGLGDEELSRRGLEWLRDRLDAVAS